ncbi:DUF2971 domain-containing protein [Lactiplantibacillus plantarum]|uniref:DUF2971 domain-containing protein n=1 Tax=Lactiplantibacillus plantarum TaxID=1590 RepID=UPI000F8F67BC|nr:DUF2971 domain-containing protein [Lactiplantibacillus plantarum]MDV3525964.1 DUF2971 domain-containing protein [Lactiplantibacillus plantarum]RUS41158.1 DUF2971 domain-containing protein [Lactiplantibacillus plantarum]RXK89931.1 DUF2971 domain-containing protein [Lactiplantibacillus plantarum]UZD33962.1 DUF2971 domain-containing protein [Lactiplantibacillus plantarum]WHQ53715.1 DUF2971 domain-containing protein [Lactiplantibacillus plantarum]
MKEYGINDSHYLVLHNTVLEQFNYASGLSIGDNVVRIKNKQFPKAFIDKSLTGIGRSGDYNYFNAAVTKDPELFMKFKNQNNEEGYLTRQDILPLNNNNDDVRKKIESQHPYLEQNGIISWLKKNTFSLTSINENGLEVGSDRLINRRGLYHYTGSIEAILNSGEWRMSHYQYEDDTEEFEYTIDLIKMIAKNLGGLPERTEMLISKVRIIVSQAYLLSMTTDYSKKMWLEYGTTGGICLEFDELELDFRMHDFLHTDENGETADVYEMAGANRFQILNMDHVFYDQKYQEKILKPLVSDYLLISDERDLHDIEYVIALYTMFFKDPKWAWQKEVRFVALQNSVINHPDGFQNTSIYEKVPYISFPLFGNMRSPITNIYVKSESQKSKVLKIFRSKNIPAPNIVVDSWS